MKLTQLSRFLEKTDTLLGQFYMPLIALGMILFALLARTALIQFQTPDYIVYLGKWYDFIKAHGGFAALQYNFADYNPPYLYLLTFATMFPISKIWAIKGISIAFDFFLAFTVYLLVSEKYTNRHIAFAAATFVLFLPTVLLNSSMWSQSDAIYASFCLLSLYFIMKKKGMISCIAAGLALAFKLQAIFFLPVLIIAVIKKEVHALYLLIIPLVYALSLLPAAIAGRPFLSMLNIYSQQSQGTSLTVNAPNFYQWIPNTYFGLFNSVGIYFTLGLILMLFFLISQFSDMLTRDMLVRSALLLLLIIPFFLPQMHERYFYVAEVLSVVYAIYFPTYLYIPVLIQIPILVSYLTYLVNSTPIPSQYLPFFLIAAISIVILDFTRQLHSQKKDANKSDPLQPYDLRHSSIPDTEDLSLLDTPPNMPQQLKPDNSLAGVQKKLPN